VPEPVLRRLAGKPLSVATNMQPSSLSGQPRIAVTQRELLGLILGCAVRGSASFNQALHAAAAAGDRDPRDLTRELLSDLAIRDWIELRRVQPDGTETQVERLRYELELADGRNWDQHSDTPQARYALTAKGRSQVSAMLSTLNDER
jgi:hypothetical protein